MKNDRLVRLLAAIESGTVTHIDEEDLRQLQATTPENIEALKQRLAELNDRLGKGRFHRPPASEVGEVDAGTRGRLSQLFGGDFPGASGSPT